MLICLNPSKLAKPQKRKQKHVAGCCVMTTLTDLRTLHVVCRKKFAKYSRKICEIFVKYS